MYINFIKSFDIIDYNEHEYQDPDASTCGQYCLLFLVLNANKNLDPDSIYILLKHFKNQQSNLKFESSFDDVMMELLSVLNS